MSSPYDSIEIDVDLAPMLGTEEEVLVNEQFYRMAHARRDRTVQAKVDHLLRNAQLAAQWRATARRRLDRRRAIRAGLLTRVRIDGGKHLIATDISLRGMRCSGQPTAPLMHIEFDLPGLEFPIESRAELMNYRHSPDFPWVGLRFIDIDRPYVRWIAGYIDRKRRAA